MGLSYDRSPLETRNSVYSVGTAIAINTFEKEYIHYGNNVVMLSVNTLLRNIISPDINTVSRVIQNFTTEIPTLLNEMTSIMVYSKKNTPVVILYAINYNNCLNETVLRPSTDSRKLLNDCVAYVINHREQLFGPKGDGMFNNIRTHFRVINNPMVPVYDKLFDFIKEVTPHRKVTMISHSAIDCHVLRHLEAFILLESHTGEWKKAHMLNLKIFGDKYLDVPFYPSTHWCLGDKNLILPGLEQKDKKVLIDVSKKEQWNSKSSRYVFDRIVSLFNPNKTIFK